MVGLTYEEFMQDAVPTDVLKLSEKDIKELEEHAQEANLRRDRDWGYLANKVVGSE